MKKLLALAIGAIAFTSTAQANWYVQGDVGYAKNEIATYKNNALEPRISLGYTLQDFRLALDYTHYKTMNKNYSDQGMDGNLKLKTRGVGFSALYDIPTGTDIIPYVGARLAINYLDYKDMASNTSKTDYNSDKSASLGYGAVVGAQYNLSKDLKLNAGVEYNFLGKIEDHTLKNYGAKVGFRYDF